MARARIIKPGFFRNEALAECSFAARLFFAGLWTLADRDGFVEFRPKRLKADLFPYDPAVEIPDLAVELHGQKFLKMYRSGNHLFLLLPTFVEHQRPHPKELPSEVDASSLVEITYEEAVKLHGQKFFSTASCALPSLNPLIPLSLNPSIPKSPSQPSADFLSFWNAYPKRRRKARGAAMKAWDKAIKKADPSTIIAAATAFAATAEAAGDYCPGPEPWLNQERWLDDPESWGGKPKKKLCDMTTEEMLDSARGNP